MTEEEKESLNYHATIISYAELGELVEYVEGLLNAEYNHGFGDGYDIGWYDHIEYVDGNT